MCIPLRSGNDGESDWRTKIMTTFKVKELIGCFTKVGDDWKTINVEKAYTISNWDDLQNLIMTLVDYSDDEITFKVKKIREEADNEQ